MHAFKLQFNDLNLDTEFISLIDASCADRLLYISLFCSKAIMQCVMLPMSEHERFQFIVLQDDLLEAIEAVHTSHVRADLQSCRTHNETALVQVVQAVLYLRDTLSERAKALAVAPSVRMQGPWPVGDFFIALDPVAA